MERLVNVRPLRQRLTDKTVAKWIDYEYDAAVVKIRHARTAPSVTDALVCAPTESTFLRLRELTVDQLSMKRDVTPLTVALSFSKATVPYTPDSLRNILIGQAWSLMRVLYPEVRLVKIDKNSSDSPLYMKDVFVTMFGVSRDKKMWIPYSKWDIGKILRKHMTEEERGA